MFARRFTLTCLTILLCMGAWAGETVPPAGREQNPTGTVGKLSSRYYADLATVHQRYKMYEKAEECLKKAIELEENTNVSADHAYQLAKVYFEWGRDADAEAMFQFSLELTPDSSSLINRSRELARFYEGKNMFDKAEAVYERAIARADGPTQRMLRRELLRLYQASGRLEDLIGEKEQELKKNPKDETLLNDLAYMYRLSGQAGKERAVYEKLAQINPRDQKALFQLAIAYRNANEVDKAVQTYEKLIKVNRPAEPYYVSEIIKLYTNAGREEDAKNWREQLVSPEESRTASGQARLARLAYQLKTYDKAVEHYRRAVELAREPRQKEHYQLQLARTLEFIDRLDEAEEVCRQLLKESENKFVQREAQVILGRIHQRRQSLKNEKK